MRSMKKIKGGELDPKVPLEPSTLFLPLLHKYVQLFCILREHVEGQSYTPALFKCGGGFSFGNSLNYI